MSSVLNYWPLLVIGFSLCWVLYSIAKTEYAISNYAIATEVFSKRSFFKKYRLSDVLGMLVMTVMIFVLLRGSISRMLTVYHLLNGEFINSFWQLFNYDLLHNISRELLIQRNQWEQFHTISEYTRGFFSPANAALLLGGAFRAFYLSARRGWVLQTGVFKNSFIPLKKLDSYSLRVISEPGFLELTAHKKSWLGDRTPTRLLISATDEYAVRNLFQEHSIEEDNEGGTKSTTPTIRRKPS